MGWEREAREGMSRVGGREGGKDGREEGISAWKEDEMSCLYPEYEGYDDTIDNDT